MNKFKQACAYSFLTVVVLFSVAPVQSQSTNANKEALTNVKVIELVKLGLSETIVVEKIRQSECNFDTSTSGLAQLKGAKVSDAIIMAMMNPQNASAMPRSTTNVSSPATGALVPPEIQEPGIYLNQDGSMSEINPTTFSGAKSSFFGTAMTYGIKKAKFRAIVRGSTANTIVNSKRPEFFFYFDRSNSNSGAAMAGFLAFGATSPAEFVLVEMSKKSNARESVLGEFNAFGSSMGARDKDIRELSFEKVKPGVFKVVPKVDLTPGEYCFYYAGTPVGLGFAGGKVFDFSVTSQE